MKIKSASIITAACILAISSPAYAEIAYSDIYASAVNEACARHDQKMATGELGSNYNVLGYALADITGDGLDELIVRQVVGKHLAEYWIYGTNGSSSYYMGEFECDARSLFGYASGIIYEEAYKGSLRLGLVSYNGAGFTVSTLFDGSYDRDAYPPSITDFSYLYDPNLLYDEVPDFADLTYGTAVGNTSSGDPHDLSRFAYRTVNTHGDGALVFQTEPYGSFMFDYQFYDGDQIFVNTDWREKGYALAYQDGVYGFVDAGYINW